MKLIIAYIQPEKLNDVKQEAIIKRARTGEIGDGKILVLDLAECIRIRTGETGSTAIG